jgi:hypothetical protein
VFDHTRGGPAIGRGWAIAQSGRHRFERVAKDRALRFQVVEKLTSPTVHSANLTATASVIFTGSGHVRRTWRERSCIL